MYRLSILAVVLFAALFAAIKAPAQRASGEALAAAGPFERFGALFDDTSDALPELGRLTLFAPTDEAFRRLPDALRDGLAAAGSDAARRALIRAHVVRGWQEEDDLPVEMETLGGGRLLATYTDGALTLRLAVPEGEADPEEIAAGRAEEAQLRAGGSARVGALLIHPVDRVLLPAGLESMLATQDPATLAEDAGSPVVTGTDDAGAAAAIAAVDDGPTGDIVPAVEAPAATMSEDSPPPAAQPTADDGEIPTLDPASRLEAPAPEDPAPEMAEETTEPGTSAAPSVTAQATESDRPADGIDLTRPVTSLADLIGAPVIDGEGNQTGEVADLLMTLETGAVDTVVIARDSGFLGLGESETSRVPLDRVAIDPLSGEVILENGGEGTDG